MAMPTVEAASPACPRACRSCYFLWRKRPQWSGCAVTPKLHLILVKTQDHTHLSPPGLQGPLNSPLLPWRMLSPGHAQLPSRPGGPTSLACPVLYSTSLASSCTLFSREQASPDFLCPSLPLPAPYSGSHAQASWRAPGAREP